LTCCGAFRRTRNLSPALPATRSSIDISDPISRASQGDRAAIEPLLERYLPAIEAYLGRQASARVRAKESPTDLAQSVCRELLERVAEGRFQFQDEPSFRKWLYRAALLKVLNKHRYWGAEGRADQAPYEDTLTPGTGAGTPSEQLMAEEQLAALEQAFKRLPDHYFQIISLSYVERLPHAEIAQRMQITEGNSRVLLARALAALARLGHALG